MNLIRLFLTHASGLCALTIRPQILLVEVGALSQRERDEILAWRATTQKHPPLCCAASQSPSASAVRQPSGLRSVSAVRCPLCRKDVRLERIEAAVAAVLHDTSINITSGPLESLRKRVLRSMARTRLCDGDWRPRCSETRGGAAEAPVLRRPCC